MRPVVEFVTSRLPEIVRQHHIYGAIGPETLHSLDRKNLECAERKQQQNHGDIGSAKTFPRVNRGCCIMCHLCRHMK